MNEAGGSSATINLLKQLILILGVIAVLPNGKLTWEAHKSQKQNKAALDNMEEMIRSLTEGKKVLEEELRVGLEDKYPVDPHTNMRPKEYYEQMQSHAQEIADFEIEIKRIVEEYNSLKLKHNNNEQQLKECFEKFARVAAAASITAAPQLLQTLSSTPGQAISTAMSMVGYQFTNSTFMGPNKSMVPQYQMGSRDLNGAKNLRQTVASDLQKKLKEIGSIKKAPIEKLMEPSSFSPGSHN